MAELKMSRVVDHVAHLHPLRADLVRCLSARRALWAYGRALRQPTEHANMLYEHSRETESIEEFWSHSWHGPIWSKVLTLLILKNGLAAMVIGSLAALTGCLLMFFEMLPIYGNVVLWSNIFGVFACALTLLLWPSGTGIFLDIGCIKQSNAKLRTQGLLSLGGILKNSKNFLLLWDSTYDQRLWCMFELSAYVHSRRLQRHGIVEETVTSIGPSMASICIHPSILGPCAIVVFIWCSLFVAIYMLLMTLEISGTVLLIASLCPFFCLVYPAAAIFRRYWHEMDSFQQRLKSFKLANTSCSCCAEHPDSESHLCDKEVIRRCVSLWFGSEDIFEEMCQSVIQKAVHSNLGPHLFPYSLCLMACSPILWGCLDLAIQQWHQGNSKWAPYYVISSFGYMAGGVGYVSATCLLARKCRRPRKSYWWDILVNLLISCTMCLVLVAELLLLGSIHQLNWEPWVQAALVCCIFIALGHLSWHLPLLYHGMKAIHGT